MSIAIQIVSVTVLSYVVVPRYCQTQQLLCYFNLLEDIQSERLLTVIAVGGRSDPPCNWKHRSDNNIMLKVNKYFLMKKYFIISKIWP